MLIGRSLKVRMPKLYLTFARKGALSLKTRLRRLANMTTGEKIVLLSILAYTVLMSYFTIMRMYALKASAWDLGNYNQAMYTFTFEGKLFYLTPELQNNPTGSLFGIHFSPIFFLQAPLYMIYPRAETLLVLQSFVLALGILPTYLISKEYFKSRKWIMLLCLAYILNPVILGINVFDFHPEIYIPTFYLFMLYYYMKYNWKGVWFFSILIMATIEFAPTLIFLFGVYFLLKDVIWSKYIQKKKALDKTKAVNLFMLIIASIVWLVGALRVITFFSPDIPLLQGKTEFWSILGASNIGQVPISAILHPSNMINALFSDGVAKGTFLLTSSISWLFLPLLSFEFWFLSSSWLLPALLSGNSAFYTVGVHYPSFFAGQLTYAGIIMVKKSKKVFRLNWKGLNWKFLNWKVLLAFILIGAYVSNPFLSLKIATNPWAGYDFPILSDRAKAVNRLLPMVPENASILAEQNIFPLVSSRSNAYTIPWQINYVNTISFFNYTFDLVNKVDYIIIDTDYWKPLSAVLLSKTSDFGVLGFQNNVLLLKRGYKAEPVFEQLSYSFHYQELNTSEARGVTLVPDASSPSGFVLKRDKYAPIGTDLSWNNAFYISIPGEYKVTFWLKLDKIENGSIGRILKFDHKFFPGNVTAVVRNIYTDSSVIGTYQTFVLSGNGSEIIYDDTISSIDDARSSDQSGDLYCKMLEPVGEYHEVAMNINVTAPGEYEFRAVDVTLPVTIYLDKIDLVLIKAFASFAEPVQMGEAFT
jgi:uncharacterized membrane protein